MKITVISVGKIKEQYLKDAIAQLQYPLVINLMPVKQKINN